jgi:hypothetical protein
MPVKPAAHALALLRLQLANTDAGGIGDVGGLRGSAAAGSLWLGLFTGDPTVAGVELSYGTYARKQIARAPATWTFSANQAALAADQDFPMRTDNGAAQMATFFAVMSAAAGGTVLYAGQVTTPAAGISVSQNVTPRLPASNTIISES